RGDRALNEIALKKHLGVTRLFLARDTQIQDALGVQPGFVGPVGLGGEDIAVYADVELRGAAGMIVGANEPDAHLTGVDLGRDAAVTAYLPLRMAEAGDRCPRCETGTL